MKRTILYVFVALVAAGWLGTLIARDPGYVLISYDGATLQTSLWVMLGLLIVVLLTLYYSMQFIKFVLRSTGYFQSWRTERQKNRAGDLTSKGFTLFQEGDYVRAEKFLSSGATHVSNPAINYIYAAKAANAQGKGEDRERYLRQALTTDAATAPAVALASGEMAMARKEWRNALEHLDRAPQNDIALRLKSEALLALQDWPRLLDLMPQMRRVIKDEGELFQLQKRIALERLNAPNMTDEGLSIVYKKLPETVQRDAEVIRNYCSLLKSETEAELAIRNALKQRWSPELVSMYGGLGSITLSKRLKTAEGWLKAHADDASLHLCLGQLQEASGDKDNARAAYQKSVDLKNSSAASAHLGRLLAFDGEYKKSNELLSQAIKLLQ